MRTVFIAMYVAAAMAAAAVAHASPLEIPLTVLEPLGVAQPHAWVTSGVPVPDSAADTRWALFDGATEVPVQVTASTMTRPHWLLLDFGVALAPGERRTYTLRHVTPAPIAPPPRDRVLTLQTLGGPGAIAGLLEHGVLARELRVTALGAGGRDTLVAFAESVTVSYDTRGPLRTTLRLTAPLGDARTRAALPGARVALALTLRDGGRALEAQCVLRLSRPDTACALKLRALSLAFGDGANAATVARIGDRVVLACGDRGAALDLIPARVPYTEALASSAHARRVRMCDTAANDGLVVADGTCIGATALLLLDTAADAAVTTRAFATPLVALAPPAWYAACGAFGLERFGTFADERAATRAWGLRDSLALERWTWPPALPPHVTMDIAACDVDVESDLEADEIWQNLLQMARTGDRGWFDRAAAWARFTMWTSVPRTDGFAYASDDYWEGAAHAVHRPAALWPATARMTVADSLAQVHDAAPARVTADHAWAAGLVDWYAFTGDRDALAAAADLCEMGERYFAWREPGVRGSALGGGRFLARHCLNANRLWESTLDPRWRRLADHLAAIDSASTTWDARGFYGERAPHDAHARLVIPFFAGIEARALERHAFDTGAAWPRTRLIAMARFAAQHGLDPANGWSGDAWLVPDDAAAPVRHMSQDDYRDATGAHFPYFDPLNTLAQTDLLALGARASGDSTLLAAARRVYERGMRRFFREPYVSAERRAGTVGRFANSLEGFAPGSLRFADNGELTYVASFLADALRAGR